MTGILIDHTSGDLLIEHSSVVVGDTDSQVVEAVVTAMRGEFKEFPLIGGEAQVMLGGERDVFWPSNVKKMLEAVGVVVDKVSVDNGVITIE